MSDQKAQSDETHQSLAMDVDTQPNGASNSQISATAAGSSSAADQISEMETGKDPQVPKPTRRDIEMNRKQRSLAEFLSMMDNYTPAIPDAVTDYYLSRTGFDCDDVRIKRLLALAAQKFITDIATDAFQFCKIRQQGNRSKQGKDRKTVLTMEDLSAALAEYGVNIKKPDYYS
ncbi:hypothetical protein INT44_002378 [Umbelopsis vinacea]|uniref:Transcription initiation factor TFIID subunit 10 n=1 Tax=Umbelopsis vinacea TaxID=44442 RepID=A0A8H7UJM8_9FUNG|nr:hypothetical protein INT44_002378 [Umbelopsis vinacea]